MDGGSVMWLDLKDIIEVPGASKAFSAALDCRRLTTPSVVSFSAPPEAEGAVVNTAGLLELRAAIRADMRCVCDRCGTEFDVRLRQEIAAPLSARVEDEGDSDIFPLEGDGIDVSDVAETCLLLETESKRLCRPDCKGLCPRCGKNLNEGPCDCGGRPVDPRFAVLGQLLDQEDQGSAE